MWVAMQREPLQNVLDVADSLGIEVAIVLHDPHPRPLATVQTLEKVDGCIQT
jgi:hypothetical protein